MERPPTVYLMSGATRGIGLALVAQLAARPGTLVFSGARNPASSPALQALAAQYPGVVHVLQLTVPDEGEARAAVERAREMAGRLDVVVANAGLMNAYVPSDRLPLEAMREHFEMVNERVNVLGPLVLFQSAWPLLQQSAEPKFVVISSIVGSLQVGTTFPLPVMAYGTSKAAANWLGRKLHFEYPQLSAFLLFIYVSEDGGQYQGSVAVPMHPGNVDTDMMAHGFEQAPDFVAKTPPLITTEESARGILNVIDAARRDEEGPRLVSFDGSVLPW
ncbi:NAD(P)-binding protein [Calocera viscosa TUFC12733]|uniref:NAD(P)-binding protein n=1 Tax=Calocera viscosa (strain TUFC12733) TaxID=1330018 RepID=A0A167I7M5_CALVF|nr:NAD(P)-binding protein [Calocera viscosa TUFC12733]